jgi:translation factor GUF1, mitochondrial
VTDQFFFRSDLDGETYLLNLIDTPGHVDFHYEVSRSMAACEGAVLLVDAVKGVQAQTVANYYLALQHGLKIVPVVNKVDLPTAQPEESKRQLEVNFDIPRSSILSVSAASGFGIEDIFMNIVERIPAPTADTNKPLKVLLFDSWYGDVFSGVICLIKLVDGALKTGDLIQSAHNSNSYEVAEIGLMYPEQVPCAALYAGQVGYVKLGMKTTQEARVGDTFYRVGDPVEPFPGFKAAKPMVWAGIYPDDANDFNRLRESVEKLCLTDASVTIYKETKFVLLLIFLVCCLF